MKRGGPRQTLRNALLAAAMFFSAVGDGAGEPLTDLTIRVGGDLLEDGGVVTVYPIPISAEAWAEAAGDDSVRVVSLDDRYAEVQLRYPDDGTYTYRFRPVEGTPNADMHATQVLSIIGVDMQGRGPRMTAGFENAYSSGGRIIRLLPMAERAGSSETERTMARWGEVEGYDAAAPADHRSARALVGVIEHGPEPVTLQCKGGELVQVCTVVGNQWPGIEARWWRAIAEQRLERLRHYALRRCYDSSWFGGGTCEPDPDSDEPAYHYRK